MAKERDTGQRKPEIGDVVMYVPGIHYAHCLDHRTNEFPWEWHHLQEMKGEWKKLDHKDVMDKHAEIRALRDSSDRGADRKRLLRPIRPIKAWRATVAQIHEDGTIEVHCQDALISGVTQGEVRVEQGPPDGSMPHSWFWPQESEGDA